MLEFIQLLKQRYQTVLAQLGNEAAKISYQQRIDQLILAEAFIRKGQLIDSSVHPLLQMAVVGPTQAGKSSVVNVLLNSNAAGVSPLAGYTIHPQGFCNGVRVADCSGLQRYFGRFQQLQQTQLGKDRFDCYSLSENTTDSKLLPHGVLWDTPDFDSIDSATYREGVIRAVALADMIILVVSKEKYADQSVWDIMAAIEELHQPTIICLNKLVEGSEPIIIESLKDKWRQARSDEFPEVVPLYYQKPGGLPVWPGPKQQLINQLAHKVKPERHARFEQELLKRHWQTWLEPVLAEHQALNDWQEMVDLTVKQAMQSYQRDYLDHPHHYETFQLAIAELLNLLEMPGLARVLAGTRKVLTWPVKQLMKLGSKSLHIADSSYEIGLLNQIAEHTLIQLGDKLLDRAEQGQHGQWWRQLNSLLRSHRQEALQDFAQAAKNYHLSFQQDVESAAHSLYYKLQDQPVVLNSLRATRATTDATVIAISFYLGGIGVDDLVIAPAMLAVTSLLAESAVGGYMHKVEAELKQNQFNTVKQALFIDSLRKKLLRLPEQLPMTTYFNISPEQLRTAELQLTEKRHGLRLL
ncbi:GTPase domain-containing protein [Candidatus Methylobacter oryzae]|uniref:GTP-binding protein n=1 Tax=Candidatus Methylobacter oryzae TaxID=2497749 RepID=A0ABY3C915_9GAMM|nr:GTPase domain-containing protein [Candidatus Methylobacter oryzae]TRW93073.1 GTP-binding protein [Candidatus Methylobacter oryzae]